MAERFNLELYDTVDSRVKKFWAAYPDGAIHTKQVSSPDNFQECLFEARIFKDKANIMFDGLGMPVPDATGYASEHVGKDWKDGANVTSHTENAETSAVGRAFANMGMSGNLRPSREEMQKASRGGKTTTKTVEPKEVQLITDRNIAMLDVQYARTGAERPDDKIIKAWTLEAGKEAYDQLLSLPDKVV